MPSSYRPEFEAALRLFARASEAMRAQGFEPPVLVGSGAVELYSNSAITTGDFDLVTGRQEAFEAGLRSLGFVRPSGPGIATRGWVHPELQLGFEIVATTLLDGLADRDRILLVDLGADGRAAVIASSPTGWASSPAVAPPICMNRRGGCYCFTATPIMGILSAASARRPLVSTASKTSKTITLEALAADIDRRRAETGVTDLPRNSGKRRTPSKQALLAAIEATGGKW